MKCVRCEQEIHYWHREQLCYRCVRELEDEVEFRQAMIAASLVVIGLILTIAVIVKYCYY